MRLWCYSHGLHTLTFNNLHTTSMSGGSRYFCFSTVPLTAEKCPQKGGFLSPRSAAVTLTRLSHIPTHHLALESKTRLLLKIQSLTSEVLGNCVVCLLECDELACSHPVLASFLLHGFFFSQCSLIQRWIEERLEPRNLFGIIATIEALCVRPAGERKRKQDCC